MRGVWKCWWRVLIAVLAAAVLVLTGYLYLTRHDHKHPYIVTVQQISIYPLWTDLPRDRSGG